MEEARQTAKHMVIAFAAVVLAGRLIGSAIPLFDLIWVISVPAYWISLAWWVYLDATWRNMEPGPWGVLTLLTNVFGLVTYLVVRYPEPRSCPRCGSRLTPELKRCPYCGAETEPTCPRCQAPVRAGWVYCPSCAAQLPTAQTVGEDSASEPVRPTLLSLRGTVVDARTGAPVEHASVSIDSKSCPMTTATDALGRFMLPDLDPRPYVLVASAGGYVSDAKAYTPSHNGQGQVHFTLHPTEVEAINS